MYIELSSANNALVFWRWMGILFSILLFSGIETQSQKHPIFQKTEPIFKHFTVNDGLPSSEVYWSIQDDDGYLWFSTDRGVTRFDGKNFETFTTKDGLCDNTIFKISKTKDGKLWFQGYNAELSFYENGRFFSYLIPDSIKNLFPIYSAVGIHVSYEGIIYIYFPDQFFKISQQGKLLSHIVAKDDNVYCYTLERSYPIVISSDFEAATNLNKKSENLYVITYDGDTITIDLNTYSFKKKIITSSISHIRQSDSTSIVMFNDQKYFIHKNKVVDIQAFSSSVISHLKGDYNDYWIGLLDDNGLLHYSNTQLNGVPEKYLDGNTISSILKDHEGGIWFTTDKNGIFYMPSPKGRHFKGIETTAFANTKDGLLFSNKTHKLFKILDYNLDKIVKINIESNYKIRYHKGKYYSINKDLNYRKVNDSVFNIRSTLPEFLSNDSFIYTAGFHRLYTYKKKNNTIPKEQKVSRINALQFYDSNTIWVGTLLGLYEGKIRGDSFAIKKIIPHPLTNGERVNDIIINDTNSWIISLHRNGLLIYENGNYFKIAKDEGLSSQIPLRIRKASHNNYWVCSSSGLDLVGKNEHEKWVVKRTFNQKDGLISNEIFDVFDNDSLLFIGTRAGLSVIPLKSKPYNTPISLDGIKVNQQKVTQKDTFSLDYTSNNISLTFNGIAYKGRKQLKYKYKMEGLDEEWIYSTANQVNYRLPSGDYNFIVYAGIDSKVWSQTPAKVHFNIATPYWQRIWFWVLVHVVIAIVIGWVIKYRGKLKEQKVKMEEELIYAKQEALSAQMNPHFLFNAMNSLQAHVLKGNKKEASVLIARFSTLLRKILNDSRERLIDLEKAIDSLEIYMNLEQTRTRDQFDYTINVSPNVNLKEVMIAPLLMQPFVENAIWHGIMPKKEKGLITINIEKENQQIVISITDNGVGRDYHRTKRKSHKSHGIDITTKRIQLMNQLYKSEIIFFTEDLYKDSIPIGTRVKFCIPEIGLYQSQNSDR